MDTKRDDNLEHGTAESAGQSVGENARTQPMVQLATYASEMLSVRGLVRTHVIGAVVQGMLPAVRARRRRRSSSRRSLDTSLVL